MILISSDSYQLQHQLVSVSGELNKPGWFGRQREIKGLVFCFQIYQHHLPNTMHQRFPGFSKTGAVSLKNQQIQQLSAPSVHLSSTQRCSTSAVNTKRCTWK